MNKLALSPKDVFTWHKYQDLDGYDFYFEFSNKKLNRFNILNQFNTKLDEQHHYIGRVLSLMLSFAYVDSKGNLISKLHGSQLTQIGMNREQRNSILTNSIADLINTDVLSAYHVKKRY